MLKYALYRNHLTKGENDFLAMPQSPVSRNIEEIIVQMTRSGSILKPTECVAVIHDFFRTISENLGEGIGFNSEYLRIQPRRSPGSLKEKMISLMNVVIRSTSAYRPMARSRTHSLNCDSKKCRPGRAYQGSIRFSI